MDKDTLHVLERAASALERMAAAQERKAKAAEKDLDIDSIKESLAGMAEAVRGGAPPPPLKDV